MESIVLADLAAALCLHPQTIYRLVHGASGPKSKWKESVSLADAARVLQTDPTVLSRFLIAVSQGEDEACDLGSAAMILDCTEQTIRNKIKAGKLPVLAKTPGKPRFSREALKRIASAS